MKKATRRGKMIKEESQIIHGSFAKDYPTHISSHIKAFCEDSQSNFDKYMFRLEWKKRADEIQPEGAYFHYKDLKQVCPVILLNYLAKYVVL